MVFELDRRIIYLVMALVLSWPIMTEYSLKPAESKVANQLYQVVEDLPRDGAHVAFVALDFTPGTIAENLPQSNVLTEHLLRLRIPILFFSLSPQAERFLEEIPQEIAERLNREDRDQHYSYGVDWVNLGYRPGAALILQQITKKDSLRDLFLKDARGNKLEELPLFGKIKNFKNIALLGEITGGKGVLDLYLQFFQSSDHRPKFVHGNTSISIPEAYTYLDSGQLAGLLEGLAGAAWYSALLSQRFPKRELDASLVTNTALGIAHLAIIALIVLGNLLEYLGRRRS